jgi:hypothetical protein
MVINVSKKLASIFRVEGDRFRRFLRNLGNDLADYITSENTIIFLESG